MDQRLPRAAIIDGKAIAARITAEVAAEARELAGQGWTPRLVSVSVGDTAAAELYVRNQQKQAENAGVAFEARSYPAETSLEQLIGILQGLNHDPRVNGIIIQRPLPEHIPVKALQATVTLSEDGVTASGELLGCMTENDANQRCTCLGKCAGNDNPDCPDCPGGSIKLGALLGGINATDACTARAGETAFDVRLRFTARRLGEVPNACSG